MIRYSYPFCLTKAAMVDKTFTLLTSMLIILVRYNTF